MANLCEPVSLNTGYYHVLLQTLERGTEYIVWVGNGIKRYYTQDTLPSELRNILAIISAGKYGEAFTTRPDSNLEFAGTAAAFFLPPGIPPEAAEVGWRASASFYCLVLPEALLASLRGE